MSCATRRVGDVMRTDLPLVRAEALASDVLAMARRPGVRHVLVVSREGDLVGIISDRDLKRLLGPERQHVGGPVARAADIMTRTVLTVNPNATVRHACDTMMQEAISALPVVEGGAVVGLVTDMDMLALFATQVSAPTISSRT